MRVIASRRQAYTYCPHSELAWRTAAALNPGSVTSSGYTRGVSVTVDLPAQVLVRLRAEARRRGVSLDEVIAELASQLPADTGPAETLAFVAAGASEAGVTPGMEQMLAEGFGRD